MYVAIELEENFDSKPILVISQNTVELKLRKRELGVTALRIPKGIYADFDDAINCPIAARPRQAQDRQRITEKAQRQCL